MALRSRRDSGRLAYLKSAVIGGLATSITGVVLNPFAEIWVWFIVGIPGCVGGLVAEFVWGHRRRLAPALGDYAIRTVAAVTLGAAVVVGIAGVVFPILMLYDTVPRCSGMHMLGLVIVVVGGALGGAWGAFIVSVVWWVRSPGGIKFLDVIKSWL